MTFPTAHSRIYYNEAGEPVGWDNPNYDEPPDPDDYYEQDWPEPDECEHDHGDFNPHTGYCNTCGEPVCTECKSVGDDAFDYTSASSYGMGSQIVQRTCLACDHTLTWETEPTT